MKKILLPILISILMTGCLTKKTINEIQIDNLEIGKCYFTKMVEQKEIEKKGIEEKPFVIEVLEPKYEKIESILTIEDMETEIDKNGYFRFQTKKPTYKIVFRDSDLRRFNTINNPNAFIYCLVEVPGEWKTVYKEEMKNDSLKITTFKLIEKSRIIKKYTKKKPNKLSTNQKYFSGGIWSKSQEVIAGSHEGGNGVQLVRKIQEKLISKGYQLQANNILDEKTKEALLDFQRKSGLKEGQIDFETLEKLEIKEYKK